ncbi:zinc finger protein 507 [Triplophysa dalaica]|uniref:zinc finger protein 507 n=1 Tax=Triplophysa dalaica TaxID=1582913 RepID=UPI0024DF6DFA|nr:zinc finger protein 507 [Triplophysa dalaica]
MEDSSGIAVLVPQPRCQQDAVFIPDPHLHDGKDQQRQQKQAADSLIQVIEKLSKIVDKRPRRCTVSGKKRPLMTCASVPVPDSRDNPSGATPCKRTREQRKDHPGAEFEHKPSVLGTRTVTCYQCSMCRFISPTLELLKEHLQCHDEQHSDLILMCSECQFTSNQQEELVAHIRLHLEEGGHARNITEEQGTISARRNEQGMTVLKTESEDISTPKKWYSFETGRYRCLICNYECRQQRNLKTHAWRHAGLVDCSYPIFEDETECPDTQTVQTQSSSSPFAQTGKEDTSTALGGVGFKPQMVHGSSSLRPELCASPEMKCDGETGAGKSVETKNPVTNQIFSIKDSQEPVLEVQVTPEAQMELELETENQQGSSDSLLSSAQKIISSSGNSAGHVNVIVERLPCAEEPVSNKPLLLSPEVGGDKTLLASEEPELESQHHPVYCKQNEEFKDVGDGWNGDDRQQNKETVSSGSHSDENVPPVRRRTHSESLRLHSLAAEVLVAMPTRAPELNKIALKGVHGLDTQNPDTGQRIIEISTTGPKTNSGELTGVIGDAGPLPNLQSSKDPKDVLVGGPPNAGISMSLLTVIERLQERSDQNTSDEDILKELQDNAQSQHGGGVAGVVAGSTDVSTTEGLVEYIAGNERPYRCRLCRYSSGNKGYIKQHLRVHRQRQPYQCPICEHIACDSKDLERHMIHHCKSRMYSCKQCSESFHYKSQLRSHERERHGIDDISSTLTHVTESTVTVEESEKMTDEDPSSEQSSFKCDVCDYTSSTYVGVRNHRRIHNSDKPYRCCSCDFATTNMNSLKGHMKKHPQEHQAMQLLEQYRCSLCGYVCSHPPSLKSHMWKHAGDQNYNYEQVNKAINEAISQSGRSPILPLKSAPETVVERPYVVLNRKDKQSFEMASLTGPVNTGTPEGSPVRSSSSGTGTVAWRGGPGQSRPGMEYCVLLFCCCICGFESTSKEQLMEHMKQHEGDLISIILSKEQQGNQSKEMSSGQ